MTLTDFINKPKSLLVAAAGHGKTHAIAECIQLCPDGQCQLILTHTHSGIASIKAKMAELKVDTKKYHVETISSFVQQYVHAYTKAENLPDQKDSKLYFAAVMDKSVKLFAYKHILDVVCLTYAGLFVDEYQDCNERQHQVIMELATVLPTHLFGDELQGIFGFDGRTVSFTNDLKEFVLFNILNKPWRWQKEGNCKELGDKILKWRSILLSDNKKIRLSTDIKAGIEVYQSYYEAMSFDSDYYVNLRKIVKMYDCNSLLIIFPSYVDERGVFKGIIGDRVKIKDSFDFENKFMLVEAIDDRSFYSNASSVDEIIQKIASPRVRMKEKKIYELFDAMSFNKTDLDDWFDSGNEYRLIDKRKDNKVKSDKLAYIIQQFIEKPSKTGVLALLNFFIKDAGMKPKRYEIVYGIINCLKNYPEPDKTVFETMKDIRNNVRRSGRKIQGRCIGTTLLTKGLEFDTVIVLDAHRFEDSKNFYVAISRACKHLVLITKRPVLHFLT